LHHFDLLDGILPTTSLVTDDQRLYGATFRGGPIGSGSVYAVNFDGTGFEVLHGFNSDDGYGPDGELAIVGSRIFGTTTVGGLAADPAGVIYAIDTDGTDFQVLHHFNQTDGITPSAGAIPYGGALPLANKLFGTTNNGGANGLGVLFSINQDGSDYRVLHEFLGGPNDGSSPVGHPILVGSRLVGTTVVGGDHDLGTIYSVNMDGSDFRLLREFSGDALDGASPSARLLQVGDRLYGGVNGTRLGEWGSLFSIALDGSDYRTLHQFAFVDGYQISEALTSDGERLYGVTFSGGSASEGVAFSLKLDGSDFHVLHEFTETPDGETPDAPLTLIEDTLYGITHLGGRFDAGTVFAITVPEPPAHVIGATCLVVALWAAARLRFWGRKRDGKGDILLFRAGARAAAGTQR
jgi:uncharacterized repeat protein (TIGR03803 family)